MALITKEIEVGISGSNRVWFENKGYVLPKVKTQVKYRNKMIVPRSTKIIVKVEDLQITSGVKVEVECDHCHKIFSTQWNNYNKYGKDNNYYCQPCAKLMYANETMRAVKLSKSISFQDWCINNLPKEDSDNILSRWDYELNKYKPNEISYYSKREVYLKCLDNLNHKSESKNLGSFVRGHNSCSCNQCNTISVTHPHYKKYFVNKEDIYKYTFSSNSKVEMICPDCGTIKSIALYQFTRSGLSCLCNDGVSYPEKFMYSVLSQLDVEFQTQLTKSTLKWCDKYRYDFYIQSSNIIIETHGGQHYEERLNWGKLENIIQNDRIKEQLAKDNNIGNYIIINCKKSELEWIKNNILNSKLNELYDLSKIDWLKCHEYACKNLVKTVADIWLSGVTNPPTIGKMLKLSESGVRRYLKQGNELGWCNYNSTKSLKVICLNTGKIYDNSKLAGDEYNISAKPINACCQHANKSSGRHPITGEKLVWQYYSDYLLSQSQQQSS